jgi:hypothetical protein
MCITGEWLTEHARLKEQERAHSGVRLLMDIGISASLAYAITAGSARLTGDTVSGIYFIKDTAFDLALQASADVGQQVVEEKRTAYEETVRETAEDIKKQVERLLE